MCMTPLFGFSSPCWSKGNTQPIFRPLFFLFTLNMWCVHADLSAAHLPQRRIKLLQCKAKVMKGGKKRRKKRDKQDETTRRTKQTKKKTGGQKQKENKQREEIEHEKKRI